MNSKYSMLDANKTQEAMLTLKGLAHPSRVKILNLLLQNEQLTFSDFQTAFPHFNKEMLSRHLHILFFENMIEKDISGKEITYQAQQEKLEKILNLVSKFS